MTTPSIHSLVCGALALLASVSACSEERARSAPRPVYEGDIEALLRERCSACHGPDDAGGDYRVDSYANVLSCTESAPDRPAIDVTDGDAPLIEALDRADHRDLLSANERARLHAWVSAAAPLRDHGVHGAGILNPRSMQWHGRLAAQDRFGPLTDAAHPQACGRCHAGAPVAPKDSVAAAAAPACSDCHGEPEGVLSCGTCHGDGARRAQPPRDRCAFPQPEHDAHRAHLDQSALRQGVLVCGTCHPAADAQLTGSHADGRLDVAFDHTLAGTTTAFYAASGVCAVACHDLGGARARPSFDQAGPLACGDCHGAPPAEHFAGACSACHAGVNAEGSALLDVSRHMNGRVDFKAGRSDCGTCHGVGDDPMPATPAHLVHRSTMLTAAIDCAECHEVPDAIGAEGHLDVGEQTPADVHFGARARVRDQDPSYRNGTCSEIACHGAGLGEDVERALRWDDRPAQQCAGCHGLPPEPPHPQQTDCASVLCHGGEVSAGGGAPSITASGRARHIDGTVDTAGAQ